ncbi:MAG: RidA family protein [Candidatus Tectomicrobia bacterium]|uniref:RidA family protein n=1 Tax=Tectimicrobiota bacterium TaxID=2528274 RepID=A0A932CNP9_UNCTE|nr:RidA family protein [Candidatus Tectomicrobia bacterium]
MSPKEEINYGTTYNQAFKYSQAIKKGQIITISGQVGWDKEGKLVGRGDFRAQAEQAIQNIKACVEAAGGTLDDVVDLLSFLPDMRYVEELVEVVGKQFKEPYPSHTAVGVTALAEPGLLLEMRAIAVLG